MKFLRITLCLFLLLTVAFQAQSAPSLNNVQSRITQANNLWDKDHNRAQNMLQAAFADAITWTRAEYIDSIRERGFYLAVSCYSPELVNESMLAADTYLKLFPNGRYARRVNIFKAMSAFAVDDLDTAVSALEKAQKARGRLSYKDQTTIMNGYITASRHRTAEKFIEGQRLVRPSYKLTKDLRRFHRGNTRVAYLLKQVKLGKVTGMEAAEAIDQELSRSYFAKDAPAAALTSLSIKDNQKLAYNPVYLEWCGLKRAVKHSASPQLREMKLKQFLTGFPEAPAAETYQALQQLKNIYRYEIRDKILARQTMEAMKSVPGYEARAEVEEIFSDFEPADMLSERGNSFLRKLYFEKGWLPYDNGALPVLEKEQVELMLAISDMVLGKSSELKISQQKGWGSLPVSMLYFASVDKKDKAWEIYSRIKPTLEPQVDRMLEDNIFPLYLPTPPGERYFMAGLAAVEKFPEVGTSLLIKSISDEPRMYKNEHGLAVLSDVYNKHMAYNEAQNVWKTLGRLHPDSIWLK
ncbi:MAG: hypothetical protein PWR01_4220 [Clostridiales bacterium]|nr:hypothetical protein [Clostridiales bacterium]MDN5283147.1 hypothetical protein [Candidatus Ozemobacter sp.]